MMRDEGKRIAAELVPVACVLASLALALGLIRAALKRPESKQEDVVIAAQVEPAWTLKPDLVTVQPAERDREPDLVAGEVMALGAWAAEERAEAEALMERARAMAGTVEATEAELATLRSGAERGEQSLDELGRRIAGLERSAVALDVERAAIQRRRDAKRAELRAAQARSAEAFAVVPSAGPRGTWRQPIVIDCREDRIQLMPDGPMFGLLDLGLGMGPRGNPVVAAVKRRAVEAQAKASPDGRPSVPYLMFLVRPDGIRAYYEARSVLESLGIAFGYELVDADWQIDAPELGRGSGAEPLMANGEPRQWPRGGLGGAGGGPEELPVWTTPEAPAVSESALPLGGEDGGGEGEGGRWRIGFAEALDREMAGERPDGERIRQGQETAGEGESEKIARRPVSAQRGGPSRMGGGGDAIGPLREGGGGFAAERLRGGGSSVGATEDGRGGEGGTGSMPVGSEGGLKGGGGGVARGAVGGLIHGGTGGPDAGQAGVTGGGTVGGEQGLIGILGGGSGQAGVGDRGRVVGGGGGTVASGGGDENAGGGMAGSGGSAGAGAGLTGVGQGAEGSSGLGLSGLGNRPGGWYDIRLVCERTGITVNPGGYRLTREAMEAGGLLLPRVRYLARRGAKAEDGTPLQPRLRFVVQAGGEGMFWLARQQTTFAGLEWPATLQVSESGRMGGLGGALGVLDP